MILAIDIGGTKFSMAVFDGDRMVRRESRATNAAGGRSWMVERIAEICGESRREFRRGRACPSGLPSRRRRAARAKRAAATATIEPIETWETSIRPRESCPERALFPGQCPR